MDLYSIEWKRIDGKKITKQHNTMLKTSYANSKLYLKSLSDIHMGKYACYVYASTGTVRQIVEIKKDENDPYSFNILIRKSKKRINLAIENVYQSLSSSISSILGEKYEFDCITGYFSWHILFM